MTKRPNFLLFITDQHRADHLGCYGNRVVRTPNIDRVAAAGCRFDRFYVANPICMPNRASMLTGRLPSVHGARHNGIPLPLTETTFVEVLARQGWRTALVGKSHLQNMSGLGPCWPRPGFRLRPRWLPSRACWPVQTDRPTRARMRPGSRRRISTAGEVAAGRTALLPRPVAAAGRR